jgi:glycosyltransferase involved in cell wall biosynthesis
MLLPVSQNFTKLISEYHYVMLFSQKEGLGLTLVESCMVGRPVITRGNDGCEACAEVCIDQYNGFVTNTIEELEKCLNSLVKVNSQKYDELSVHAREIYNQKFQLQTMLSKYVDYLENIWKERNEK